MVWQNGQSNLVASIFSQPASLTIPTGSINTPILLQNIGAYNSYDLSMALVDTGQATLGHPLTCSVQLLWYDDLISGIPIYSEIWNVWVVAQNPSHPTQGIIGSGPMHGQYMTVNVGNVNTTAGVVMPYFNLFGSSRNIQLSDWRQSMGNHVNDHSFTLLPVTESFAVDNTLADTSGLQAVTSGISNYWIPLALYSGPVYMYIQVGSGGVLSASVSDVGSHAAVDSSGNISDSQGQMTNDVLNASNTSVLRQFYMPRSASALFINVSTTGTFGCKVVAQQGA
jgi:hypothetical protein